MIYGIAQWPSGGASLDPEYRDSREHDDAVALEVEQLMAPGGEYHPFTEANVAEALGEIAACMGEELKRMAWQLGTGNVCLAGATLNYAIEGYWRRMATEQADARVELQARERRERNPDDWRDDPRDSENDR